MPSLRDIADNQYRQKIAREYSHIPQEQYYNPIGDALTQAGRNVKERIGALGRSATTLGDLASWQQAGRNLGEVNKMLTADPTLAMDAISPIGIVGMFAGKGARTANLAMLAKAEEMSKAGIPDSQIWKETGWALDTPDKMPRFEIPDNAASFRNFYDDINMSEGRDIQNVLQHDPIYSGYPESANIQFSVNKFPMAENRGSFSDGNIEISNSGLGVNPEEAAKSTILHELQHAIQQREGFARGGSPDNAPIPYMDEISAIRTAKNQLHIDPYRIQNKRANGYPLQQYEIDRYKQWEDLTAKEDELLKKSHSISPFEQYQRLAGEAEARLTQSRMNLTPEERLAQYPYDPEYFKGATGVNLKDLIVRKDGGTAMSIPNSDIPSLMTDAEKAMLKYELSKIPKKPAVSLRDLAIGGGALGAGGLAGYYGMGAME